MAGSIAELLTYKKEVEIKHPKTDKVIAKVWVRLLGDEDLKQAYQFSRIQSALRRKALRNPETVEYQDEIETMTEQPISECLALIRASKENQFRTEAPAIVVRGELPKIEEIADEPDAPGLEAQEILDEKTEAVETTFLKAINEYVETKLAELNADLSNKSDEEIVKMAQFEMSNILPLQAFATELNDQKGYRGTFTDKDCKTRAFKNVAEFKNASSALKEQIIQAYNDLEMSPDDIKN